VAAIGLVGFEKMRNFVLLIGFGGVILTGPSTPLLAISMIVPGATNVFVAGQDTTGINTMGGLFPTAINVSGATSLTFTSVTGSTTCGVGFCSPSGGIGPDGAGLLMASGAQDGTNIASGNNGISGIQFTSREMFLVGVFLDNNVPSGFGPFVPVYTSTGGTGVYSADNATSQSAFFLGQVFYIGDGRTGINNPTGALETFAIPTGATRLFLGFADSLTNFSGAWGAYGDNGGSLNVTLSLGAVPEPGTVMLMGLGITVFSLLRKRLVGCAGIR
jgi:hypothetical protein